MSFFHKVFFTSLDANLICAFVCCVLFVLSLVANNFGYLEPKSQTFLRNYTVVIFPIPVGRATPLNGVGCPGVYSSFRFTGILQKNRIIQYTVKNRPDFLVYRLLYRYTGIPLNGPDFKGVYYFQEKRKKSVQNSGITERTLFTVYKLIFVCCPFIYLLFCLCISGPSLSYHKVVYNF